MQLPASLGTYRIATPDLAELNRLRIKSGINWLFCGSDSGGDRAAAICKLTETAKLNGLDPEECLAPEECLRKVLMRIADHPVRPVHELLPRNVAEVRHRLHQREAA